MPDISGEQVSQSFSVERVGRPPVHVPNLAAGISGGIQPDRLQSLLLKCDDDGLLARFLACFPDREAPKRPLGTFDDAELKKTLRPLYGLKHHVDENGEERPCVV